MQIFVHFERENAMHSEWMLVRAEFLDGNRNIGEPGVVDEHGPMGQDPRR